MPVDQVFESAVSSDATSFDYALSRRGDNWLSASVTSCRSGLWNQEMIFKSKATPEIVAEYLQDMGEAFDVDIPYFMVTTKNGKTTYYRVLLNQARRGPSFGQVAALPSTMGFENYWKNYQRIKNSSKLLPHQILAIISKIPDYSGSFTTDVSRFCIHPAYLNYIKYAPNYLTKGSSIQVQPPVYMMTSNGSCLRLKSKFDKLESYDAMYVSFLKNVENIIKTMVIFGKKKYRNLGQNLPALSQASVNERLEKIGLKSFIPYTHVLKEGQVYIDYASLGRRINLAFRLADLETFDKRWAALFNLVRAELETLDKKNK